MSTIPDSLTRKLCETLNLWDGGDYGIDAFRLVEDQLAPVIAKYMNAAPPRDCCASRMGRQHATDCPALAAAVHGQDDQ